jgi:WD40 repeat protein
VACLYNENRVVIHDLETGHQRIIQIERPIECATSTNLLAIPTFGDGLRVFTIHGVLVHVVPDSTQAKCVSFHPRNTNILAIGYKDGSVRMWDVSAQAFVSFFKAYPYGIVNLEFAPDGRLFLSSYDFTASIVTLNDQFQHVSSIKLNAHADWVNHILPLAPLNKCVTCSNDQTLKVWDCETGVCLRTLTEHTNVVTDLAMHSSGSYFASGSTDRTVIIWSSETFEVLRRISFPNQIQSIVFGESDTLFAAVYDHSIMSCNALTGEIGPVTIPQTGSCHSLAFGKTLFDAIHKPHHSLTFVIWQYLHTSPGLPPHLHCGPCLRSTKCMRLWWCCGRRS